MISYFIQKISHVAALGIVALVIIAGIYGDFKASQRELSIPGTSIKLSSLPTALPEAYAATTHNMSGFAYSENIGWISFNCTDLDPGGCTNTNYGVHVNPLTGYLSGYAWSENIGWISFNPESLVGCPYPRCSAYLLKSRMIWTAGGSNIYNGLNIRGWARACSVFDTGCSGSLKPDSERGGWDGWISFSCFQDNAIDFYCQAGNITAVKKDRDIPTQAYLYGWATGGSTSPSTNPSDPGGIGWISFNCRPFYYFGDHCATSQYEVIIKWDLPIINFTATNPVVVPGGSTQLNWTVTNASNCAGKAGTSTAWSITNSGTKNASSGVETVGPLAVDTTFTLECGNIFAFEIGSTTRSVTVQVKSPPAVTLDRNPTLVSSGQTSLLTWTVSNADTCDGLGGAAGDTLWRSAKSPTGGSFTTTPLSTGVSYTIECGNLYSGSIGSTTRTVTIQVETPTLPTVTFDRNPALINSGENSQLTWTVTNADTCVGVGGAASDTIWRSAKSPTSGVFTTVPLTANTSYSIECGNLYSGTIGSTTKTVTIQVGTPTPPSVNFDRNPTLVDSGQTSQLTWTVTNADTCDGLGGAPSDSTWRSAKNPNGGVFTTVPLTADTSYTIECGNLYSGTIGSTTQSVNIQVNITSDFSLSALPVTINKNSIQLNSATAIVRVNPIGTYAGTVNFSASPLVLTKNGITVPVTYSFSPSASLSSGNYSQGLEFYLTSVQAIPPGVYTITLTGTDGVITKTIPITLNVSTSTRSFEEF